MVYISLYSSLVNKYGLKSKKFGKYYEFLKISFGFLMVIYLLSILEVGQRNTIRLKKHPILRINKKITKNVSQVFCDSPPH